MNRGELLSLLLCFHFLLVACLLWILVHQYLSVIRVTFDWGKMVKCAEGMEGNIIRWHNDHMLCYPGCHILRYGRVLPHTTSDATEFEMLLFDGKANSRMWQCTIHDHCVVVCSYNMLLNYLNTLKRCSNY